jgi:hypothetical protein
MQTIAQQMQAVLGGLKTAPENIAESVTYTDSTGTALPITGFVGFQEPGKNGASDSEIDRQDGTLRRTSITFTVQLSDIADPNVGDVLERADGTVWVAVDILHKGFGFAVLRFDDIEIAERTSRNHSMRP